MHNFLIIFFKNIVIWPTKPSCVAMKICVSWDKLLTSHGKNCA